MAVLDAEQIKRLDSIRQDLIRLQTSLNELGRDLSNPERPLPSWSSFQSHFNGISRNSQTISTQMTEHQHFLASATPYPLMQYPAHGKAFVIESLFRTKMEPDVEEWVEQAEQAEGPAEKGGRSSQLLSMDERHELWQWAPGVANAEARRQPWGADYTLAEVEAGVQNLVTGLRRELELPPEKGDESGEEEEDEGEEEQEEDESMEVDTDAPAVKVPGGASAAATGGTFGAQQMPLDAIHKFMTTGKVG